jgi:branched-chain amino acid transport system ATP-binding protein
VSAGATAAGGPAATTPAGPALLEVRGITRRFGGVVAVKDVSFSVAAGSIQGVIGPNGAGKTTLFNLVAGSLAPNAGEVRFRGARISGRSPHQVSARGIARTFQNVCLFPGMSVLETVMVGRHRHGSSGLVAGLCGLPAARREARRDRASAMATLEWLGIAPLADADATALALGQQRAVELARALAMEPALLLLDEPAAGLNMRETAELSDRIRKIRAQGITLLLVEHDMSLVMDVCEALVVLSFGEKIAEGTPHEIQSNPEVVRIYLGDDGAER